MKSRYALITTVFHYGSKTEWTEKENVKSICEKEKAKYNDTNIESYVRIEVVNTDTGEIREYWNNHDNKINF